jgi:hypothetical protein
MRKKSAIVSYTAKQVKAKIGRGEDRTDWKRAHSITGKKLEASIRADGDDVHDRIDWTKAVQGEWARLSDAHE